MGEINDLLRTRSLYQVKNEEIEDLHGFVDTGVDKCDSLLTSCLAHAAGKAVAWRDAEDPKEPGRWYRDSGHSCTVASGQTDNGFSADMALGLLLCAITDNDLGAAQRFLAYVDAHGGLMSPDGDGVVNLMQPLVRYLYKSFIANYQGFAPPPYPEAKTFGIRPFEVHLLALGAIEHAAITGNLNDAEILALRAAAVGTKRNAMLEYILHRFTDGNEDDVVAELRDPSLFPVDRLPTSADRGPYYLWEHGPDDWIPSGSQPPTRFSGTDLSVVVALLNGEIVH